jgi:hypothetical protein
MARDDQRRGGSGTGAPTPASIPRPFGDRRDSGDPVRVPTYPPDHLQKGNPDDSAPLGGGGRNDSQRKR